MNAASRLGFGGRVYTSLQVFGSIVSRKRLRVWTSAPSAQATATATAGIRTLSTRFSRSFEGLLTERAFDRYPAPAWPERDLFDYGAERVLVVDDDLLVDLLVRRGVHASARAIIVSGVGAGYPADVIARVRALLEQRPDLPVFSLHASGNSGPDVAEAIGRLFGRPLAVRDLGLSPEAAKNIAELRWTRRLPSVPVEALPSAWLTVDLVDAMTNGVPLESLEHRERREATSGDYG